MYMYGGGERETEAMHMYVHARTHARTQTWRREGEGASAADTVPAAEPDMGLDLRTLSS